MFVCFVISVFDCLVGFFAPCFEFARDFCCCGGYVIRRWVAFVRVRVLVRIRGDFAGAQDAGVVPVGGVVTADGPDGSPHASSDANRDAHCQVRKVTAKRRSGGSSPAAQPSSPHSTNSSESLSSAVMTAGTGRGIRNRSRPSANDTSYLQSPPVCACDAMMFHDVPGRGESGEKRRDREQEPGADCLSMDNVNVLSFYRRMSSLVTLWHSYDVVLWRFLLAVQIEIVDPSWQTDCNKDEGRGRHKFGFNVSRRHDATTGSVTRACELSGNE